MWGKRVVCGEAGTGLGRQGHSRVWLCSGGAAKARFIWLLPRLVQGASGLRLKPVTFAMFLTFLLKCGGGVDLGVGQDRTYSKTFPTPPPHHYADEKQIAAVADVSTTISLMLGEGSSVSTAFTASNSPRPPTTPTQASATEGAQQSQARSGRCEAGCEGPSAAGAIDEWSASASGSSRQPSASRVSDEESAAGT